MKLSQEIDEYDVFDLCQESVSCQLLILEESTFTVKSEELESAISDGLITV